MVANLARLRACVRVARKMSHAFSRSLDRSKAWGSQRQLDENNKDPGGKPGPGGHDVRSGTEKHDHAALFPLAQPSLYLTGRRTPFVHEGVRKPHFGTVYGAIAGALDDGQEVMVFRIENDAFGGSLRSALSEIHRLPLSVVLLRPGCPSKIAP